MQKAHSTAHFTWNGTPIVESYAACLTKRACLTVSVCFTIQVLSIVLVGLNLPELDPGGSSYVSREGLLPAQVAQLQIAQDETLFNIDDTGLETVAVDPQSVQAYSVQVIYQLTGSADTLFTTESLNTIRDFETKFQSVDDYDQFCYKDDTDYCQPPTSPTLFFFGTTIPMGPNTTIIPDGNSTLIDESLWDQAITEIGSNEFFRNFLLDVDYDADSNLATMVTRSVFSFGAPLPASVGDYLNPDDNAEEQASKFEEWIEENIFDDILVPAFDNTLEGVEFDNIQVLFLGSGVSNIEFTRLIGESGMLSGFATNFVLVFLILVTWSVTLGGLGTWHVLMAFPGAYLVYAYIFGAKVFTTLNILAIFIVLGIGADDIFVFLDAWKQSAYEGPAISGSAETRLKFTLSRSVWAMFVTSLTSSAAFFANAASPIPGIRYFGLWTGSLIVVNYLYVITWYPAVVILHQRSVKYGCIGCCRHNDTNRKNKKEAASANAEEAAPAVKPEPRAIERWFRNTYAPWVHKNAWPVLGFFAVLIIASGIIVSGLRPSENQSQFIRTDQNAYLAGEAASDSFPTSDLRTFVSVVFGLSAEGIDREGTDPLDPNDLGTPVIVDAFNAADTETQQFIVDACEAIADLEDTETVTCFMSDLWAYNNVTAPIPENDFLAKAQEYATFVDNTNFAAGGGNDFIGGFGTGFADTIGFSNDDEFNVVWIAIIAETVYDQSISAVESRPVYDVYEAAVEALIEDAPEDKGLKEIFQTSNAWISMVTEEALITVAIGAILLSILLAFVVLGTSTRNLFITSAATGTIAGIALTSTAVMPLVGWELGIIESINLTIVVGLAVDYVVHYGVAYVESSASTRLGRIQDSLGELGISILQAAITTMGATAFMLPAKVDFFSRFGAFIIFVSAISLLYSSGFFFALCAVAGPVPVGETYNKDVAVADSKEEDVSPKSSPAPETPRPPTGAEEKAPIEA